MAISGAIFDCDGTLLDSMSMWASIFGRVAGLNDKKRVREVFEATETLPLYEQCFAVRELLSDVWVSNADPYEEVTALVRTLYRDEVAHFEGVHAFLDELKAAGIPMIVASSTSTREVRSGLESHGLLDYFQDVVSTADVGGRDKEFPDVYLEALRRLGTPLESTWVFEDAPFGARTAKNAGFCVCALYNEGDGRDIEAMYSASHILVHGYPELSLALLEDYEVPSSESEGVLNTLIVNGSPASSAPSLVRELARECDYLVAVDKGAELVKAAGLVPDVFCGDSDSCAEELASWARENARRSILFPAEKYATDLSLAIDAARHEATRQKRAPRLTLTSASGGRPDHALGALGLMLAARDTQPRMCEDGFELRILADDGALSWELGAASCGHTFSFVPLSLTCEVSLQGMQWNLDHMQVELLSDLGISNRVLSNDARIVCHKGALAAFLIA